ncbi:VOC family protein [Oceanobacillus piezotolerans]|uniref:VOC family protein n=1 Tax=Oceanobacillus piezotolerans TaxID=2448030 RepID=A0A498D9S5_9BACI|nr:VOC family protein [Oceanobacillus piezotolerans]RLL41284.1 VOC family protein [Oceanobacillus piezotolerans]
MEKKFFEKPSIYVGQVNLNVTNLERSLAFYRDFMGFKVLEESNRKAVLTADGKTPLITLEQPDNVTSKQGRTTGLYHMAILLPSRADLAAFLKHLIQATNGQMRLGASDHYVSEALYFDDPDGNGIEIARDRHSSEWEWTGDQVSMATVALDGDGLLAETDEPWKGMPENTLMGHIHLHVADLEKTENFYVNGLGFDVVTRFPGALFTSTNGYHHHIGLNVWNGVGAPKPAENSVGMNWFTLIFPDEAARAEQMRKLEGIGATVTEYMNDFVVEDPSGNKIVLSISA